MEDNKMEQKDCLVEKLKKEAERRGVKNPVIYVSCKCPKCAMKC